MESKRQQKISRLIQKEMAEIFQREGFNLFLGSMISVTTVKITPDLSYAKVYVSIFAPKHDIQDVFALIKDNNKKLRGLLSQRVGKQLRVIPELQFFIDDSLDYMENIERLLDK